MCSWVFPPAGIKALYAIAYMWYNRSPNGQQGVYVMRPQLDEGDSDSEIQCLCGKVVVVVCVCGGGGCCATSLPTQLSLHV